MHYADINAALHKARKPPAQLARELEVPRSNVSMVIHGKAKSRRIANRIAKITGLSVDELWPGKYSRASKSSQPSRRDRVRKVA